MTVSEDAVRVLADQLVLKGRLGRHPNQPRAMVLLGPAGEAD